MLLPHRARHRAATGPLLSRALVCLTSILLLAGCSDSEAPATTKPAEAVARSTPAYVGSEQCSSCHADIHADWLNSHHAKAMLEASDSTVLGDFDNASFEYNGVTSTFFRKGDSFRVRTDDANGDLAEFTVRYTFGVAPLQQYLIALDYGRVQALGIAWDSRPESAGGQRWFHLYPAQAVDHTHHLHWTSRDQSWNYMCAECHSTRLRKNYDAATDTFATSYSEINVACEACHGPASNHVSWARSATAGSADKGLLVHFNERDDVYWLHHAETGKPYRSEALKSSREINTCARCHSRRSILSEQFVHGQPLGNSHRLAALDSGLYHPDGQPADETFVHGSFLQSKMAQAGVTCSDCHDPHSADLKLPGNAVCAQCHAPSEYDTPEHHFHPADSDGAQCAECHMPVTRFMGVDDRHDHSFRVPRPDLTETLGTPNACGGCHRDESAAWAADKVRGWLGRDARGYQQYAHALAGGRLRDPAAWPDLLALANGDGQPGIARASAINLLAGYPALRSFEAISAATRDGDPLVRRAAAEALAAVDSAERTPWLVALLDDPVRDVRFAAANALANTQPDQLEPATRRQLSTVLDDYVAAQLLNADRPEAWMNIGALAASQRDAVAAEQAYQSALKLDADFSPALVNLADLYRALGREEDCHALLTDAVARIPDDAGLHYALGLSFVRRSDNAAALGHLQTAATLAAEDARFPYALALIQESNGNANGAIGTLRQALDTHPWDIEILSALASFAQAHGDDSAQTLAVTRLQAIQAMQR